MIYVIEARPKGSEDEWNPKPTGFPHFGVDAVLTEETADSVLKGLSSHVHEFRLMPYERMEVQP